MPIRDFSLPGDFDTLTTLILPSFQYPENDAWSIQDDEAESILDQVKGFRRIWPLMRLLQLAIPSMRDALRGYVWEEDGQPVGLVNVARLGSSARWEIGNVSVLPDYRRRGIAHQLVEACIQQARDHGARQITLNVIDGNVPAYSLYERLGFVQYSGEVALSYTADGPLAEIPLPDAYELVPRKLADWRPRLTLAQRIVPQAERGFEPVEPERFRQPRLMVMIAPVIFTAMGERVYPFWVRRKQDQQVVAAVSMTVRQRKGGINRLGITLDPGCGEIAPALVHTLVREIVARSPGRRIEAEVKQWQEPTIAALLAAGFHPTQNFHSLGMLCTPN